MTGRVSKGMIRARFKEWIVPFQKAVAAMEALNEMRETKRNTRWDTEQIGAHILAPSHSGKSHTVNKMYFSRFVIPELRASGAYAPDVSDGDIKRLQKKVVYAKVPAKPTSGDFATMLLAAYDDPFPAKRENVLDRIRRAGELARHHATELLILDRFDQLTKLNHDNETMRQASVIQEIIKNMMEDGWPIALVGLPNANAAILNNMQLKNRITPIDLMPMRFLKDMEEFYKFLAGLELLMLDHGMFDKPSGLCDDYTAVRLYYASQGRLGVLCNIVRDAALIASPLRTASIDRLHLAQGVDGYSFANGICEFNPFYVDDDDVIAAHCKVRVAEDEKSYDEEYKKYFY